MRSKDRYYEMRFTAKLHEEHGAYGFVVEGRGDFDPLMAIAHDVLEHFPDDDQTLAGECQALGASLWIRGLSGYYQRNGNVNPPPRHVSADISRFIMEMLSGEREDFTLPEAPRNTPRPKHDDHDWRQLKNWLEDIKNYCREDWDSEYEYAEPEHIYQAKTMLPSICRWIKIGFHRARTHRYRGWVPSEAADLYGEIDEFANKLHAKSMAMIGEKLVVRLDMEERTVRCYVEYPEYDEEE